MNYFVEFYARLNSLVQDGGAKALETLASIARDERDEGLKGPAMAAMLCWNKNGCAAIAEIALTEPSVKNVSSAFKILSAAAAGNVIDPQVHFIHDDQLVGAINAAIGGGRLRQAARETLMDVLQALNSDDILIPLGVAFTQFGLTGEKSTSELVRGISSRWLRMGLSSPH